MIGGWALDHVFTASLLAGIGWTFGRALGSFVIAELNEHAEKARRRRP